MTEGPREVGPEILAGPCPALAAEISRESGA